MCTHICVRMYVCMRTPTLNILLTLKHHTNMHICTLTHANIILMHTYTHTYIHTYIQETHLSSGTWALPPSLAGRGANLARGFGAGAKRVGSGMSNLDGLVCVCVNVFRYMRVFCAYVLRYVEPVCLCVCVCVWRCLGICMCVYVQNYYYMSIL